MTLDEFYQLSSNNQYELTIKEGIRIGYREDAPYYMILYRLFDFYMEIKCRLKDDSVFRLGAFDHDILIQPYLDQIDLSDLF